MEEERNVQEGCAPEACAGCASAGSCPSRKEPQSLLEEVNKYSNIKKVIGVASGKGGVGKSFVTGTLAVELSKKGYAVGILDADITGPSIPKMFGITGQAEGDMNGIYPKETANGIRVMSINMLLENAEDPVLWRGPVLAGVVKQFWTDVVWGELDYLLVDLPPGTGDVPLTVFQSIPIDGLIIVTSPQSLVTMIVKKAYNMAEMMNIPVLGLIENYSYLRCPDCGREIEIFGKSRIDEIAKDMSLDVLGKMPMDPDMARLADEGRFELIANDHISKAVEAVCEER